LRGGDEGEGDACGFTNDRVSKLKVLRAENIVRRILNV
jgi:hypothetical protein